MTDMIGGALKKSISGDSTSALFMFIGFFLVLFIKVYLVKISYNNVVPKIMKDDKVYRLTYLDALFVVILLMR
jgi:hypothetical protein